MSTMQQFGVTPRQYQCVAFALAVFLVRQSQAPSTVRAGTNIDMVVRAIRAGILSCPRVPVQLRTNLERQAVKQFTMILQDMGAIIATPTANRKNLHQIWEKLNRCMPPWMPWADEEWVIAQRTALGWARSNWCSVHEHVKLLDQLTSFDTPLPNAVEAKMQAWLEADEDLPTRVVDCIVFICVTLFHHKPDAALSLSVAVIEDCGRALISDCNLKRTSGQHTAHFALKQMEEIAIFAQSSGTKVVMACVQHHVTLWRENRDTALPPLLRMQEEALVYAGVEPTDVDLTD